MSAGEPFPKRIPVVGGPLDGEIVPFCGYELRAPIPHYGHYDGKIGRLIAAGEYPFWPVQRWVLRRSLSGMLAYVVDGTGTERSSVA